MDILTANSNMTRRISVPCTPELKQRIQQEASACHLTESEYIRRLIENASVANRPSLSDENLKSTLRALYMQQKEDRQYFETVTSKLLAEIHRLPQPAKGYNAYDYINTLSATLVSQIRMMSYELEGHATARSHFYYYKYFNAFKNSDILM